jgi:hypothetical protein
MLRTRGTGEGNSAAVGRAVHDLSLHNVIIVADEK